MTFWPAGDIFTPVRMTVDNHFLTLSLSHTLTLSVGGSLTQMKFHISPKAAKRNNTILTAAAAAMLRKITL